MRVLADDEEARMNALLLEDVEDLRRPVRVGPVVEGQRELARCVAPVRSMTKGVGTRRIFLVDDLSRSPSISKVARTLGRLLGYVQDLALAFEVDVLASPNAVEVLGRRRVVATAKGRPY